MLSDVIQSHTLVTAYFSTSTVYGQYIWPFMSVFNPGTTQLLALLTPLFLPVFGPYGLA